MNAQEINFDGLVGPTHNYSGLSYGNVASMANQQAAANPREAALQGLEKMRFMTSLGLVQAVLPPHQRPFVPILRELGYDGQDCDVWAKVSMNAPELINACSSAAAMWTANAATVSPSVDSRDGKLHITPANLVTKFHRSLEPPTTLRILKAVFPCKSHRTIHPPLPSSSYFSDEGAANHTRLCRLHSEPGIQIFTWGRSSFHSHTMPGKFPARQTLEASQALARRHRLDPNHVVLVQQNPAAIDAGVFHNDVISVGNQNVFLFHEEAFVSTQTTIEEITRKFQEACRAEFIPIRVNNRQVTLQAAVETYLFNSQLVTLNDNSMAMIAPAECEQNDNVRSFLEGVQADQHNPIRQIYYLNLRESMRNGGGPACLRLRVVLTNEELSAMNQAVILTNELYGRLKKWILKHYRDRLLQDDLSDPKLLDETKIALDELTGILKLGPIYDFQR